VGVDRNARELTSVVPIITAGKGDLVAPCTFVTSGKRTIGVTSSERLRPLQGVPLVIATKLDGSATIPVASWSMSFGGIAIVELGGALTGDVTALEVGKVCATMNTRGAPAALVAIEKSGKGFVRTIVQVDVDVIDGNGMSDVITRLASPREASKLDADGATLFAWFPADPALARPAETLLVALGLTYRHATFKPREQPALAELVGLEELGRALAFAAPKPEARDKSVTGEIKLKS
jgi:hypothetical protein